MSYIDKVIKEREKQENFFGDKVLIFNNKLKELKNNLIDKFDEKWITDYYKLCQEFKDHSWTTHDKEFCYFTNASYSAFLYNQFLSLDLMKPSTQIYKKHFLIKEGDPEEENVDEIIDVTKLALEYTEKALNFDFKKISVTEYSYKGIKAELTRRKSDCLHKLGVMYSFYKDVEQGILYYEQGANLGSVGSIQSLVYIYLQDEFLDLDKSLYYYDKLKKEYGKKEQTLFALCQLFYYYKKNGLYFDCKELIKDYRKNVLPYLDRENIDYASKCLSEIEIDLEKANQKNSDNKILEEYFSQDILSKMEEKVKVFITTSIYLKKYVDEQNLNGKVLDYSAVTMPAMKALESVLFDIFGINYLGYLNSKKDELNLSKIDNCFINKEGKLRENVINLELGSILHLTCKMFVNYSTDKIENKIENKIANKIENKIENKIANKIVNLKINDYFAGFCKEKCGIEDVDSFIKEFSERLYSLKEKRNETAHKNRIFKEDADEVNNELIEQYKFIKFLYESFKVLF